MEKIIDNNVYCDAIRMALKVGFLTDSQELKLYAGALYAAMMWGRGFMKIMRSSEKMVIW